MTNSEKRMIKLRPVGPRSRWVKPLPCGMRSFIFCRAVFSSEFATTNNSLMTAGARAAWLRIDRRTQRVPRLSHFVGQALSPNAAYFVVQSDLWHSPSKPEHFFTGLFRRLWV